MYCIIFFAKEIFDELSRYYILKDILGLVMRSQEQDLDLNPKRITSLMSFKSVCKYD